MSSNRMGQKSNALNVIGLISGGKDSFFSLLHCLANGHRIIALANLYPPRALSRRTPSEDLNSYMYQTVGHGLVSLYSDALRLPLFRQEIIGTAMNPSKFYEYVENNDGPQSLDETEDLMSLLRRVLQQCPDANAVCSGAILSSYQRTRIESVARRLELVPLSYLWQYPSLPPPSPGGLLDDMAAVDFDVRIVKVASGGLDEDLLWQNLMNLRTRERVRKCMRRFGGSILGEGGEYETLLVSGPMPVFKESILVDERGMSIEKGEGGEAWLTFKEHAGKLVTNEKGQSVDEQQREKLPRSIGVWDVEFEEIFRHLRENLPFFAMGTELQGHVVDHAKTRYPSQVTSHLEVKSVVFRTQATLTVYNLTSHRLGSTTVDQMSDISSTLLEILAGNNRSTGDIIFTTILLRSMADFTEVNDTYGQLFTKPNPPARVTVACGESMPNEVSVMVSFVVDLGPSAARDGLHVQSRSYWAPANIGPYSQAVSVPSRSGDGSSIVYVAGQIPLVPASMEVLQIEDGNEQTARGIIIETELFQKRACLALQHMWRIGKVMSVSWWIGGIAFISGESDVQTKAVIAWETWKAVHQRELWVKDEVEDDGLDAWDKKYGGLGSLVKDETEVPSLPDIARLSDSSFGIPPGFFAVQVDELPRGCDIEWQGLGSTDPHANAVSYLKIPSKSSDHEFSTTLLAALEGHGSSQLQQVTIYTQRTSLLGGLDLQIVPCGAIYGPVGEELAAGIVLHYA